MTIITKGMGAIAKMALRKPKGTSGGRSVAAEKAKAKKPKKKVEEKPDPDLETPSL